jgi:AcrR family transcriptional regulator
MKKAQMAKTKERLSPEKRKAQILDAALKCFMAKGYNKTTIDDIAHKAKLSKGTVYWYFKDKQDVFISFYSRELEDHQQELMALFGRPLSLEQRVRDFGNYLLKQAEESPERNRTMHELWVQALDSPRVWKAFEQMYKALLNMAEGLAREAIKKGELSANLNPSWVALLLVSVIDNLDHLQMFGFESTRPYDYWAWATKVLFSGLSTKDKTKK